MKGGVGSAAGAGRLNKPLQCSDRNANVSFLYGKLYCAQLHIHTHLSQHAHGSPHDADVANSGMGRSAEAEALVAQSLPNLFTNSFTQSP